MVLFSLALFLVFDEQFLLNSFCCLEKVSVYVVDLNLNLWRINDLVNSECSVTKI